MRFSLILATVGRVKEPERFLASLDAQTYRDFELIVVDQNPDDRLQVILQPYCERFPIRHLRSDRKGVCRARNTGLQHASGDIVSFPDDDCWYPANLLEQVTEFFSKHPEWDGVTGRSVDTKGCSSVGRWDKREGPINRYNEWTRSVEFSIFVRRPVAEHIGGFDEELGPGADTPWGAHEGDDFVLRALQAGFRFYYNPKFLIYHPHPVQQYDNSVFQRAYRYGLGAGRVLRKHGYPYWFIGYGWARSLIGIFYSLIIGRINEARFRWESLRGRIVGWLAKE